MLNKKMMVGSHRVVLRIAQALLACLLLPAALAQNWTSQSPGTSPSARSGSAMVYDSVHHQTVLFGGQDASNTPLAETWTYDGTTWTKQNPLHPPPARVWPGMAFDATHGQAVLFGGISSSVPPTAYLHDTWVWNGTDWTNANPSAFPAGRQGPAMAYGSPIGSPGVYLFGGSIVGGAVQSDTWAWDGTNWTLIAFSTPPPGPRRFASMSYDPVDGVMVLFAGDTGSAILDDTWTLDENGWAQQSPHNSPSPRTSQWQAWDPDRQLTVMFGGSDKSDTWTWNGSNWVVETTYASPTPRSYVNMVYDQQHADMVLFGGLNGTTSLADTWTLGFVYTQNWMQVGNSDGGPTVTNGSAVFQDSSAGLGALLFGGSNGTSVSAETWLWLGDQWTHEIINSPPPARQSAAMAYDPVAGEALLFGGNSSVSGTALLGDTWTFDGSSWTSHTVASPPAPRENQAMAYDGANYNTVMFGGFGASYLGETWLWNGSSWSQLNPSALAPSARANPGMVFDAARGQITLFGGYNGTTYLSDTWVWNGTAWTKLTTLHNPSPRSNFAMVFDSIHGTVLLFGGVGAGGQVSDTWSWDGVDWSPLSPVTTPNVRVGAASTFLPGTGQFVLIGGELGTTIEDVTWIFASPDVPSTALPVAFFGQSYSNSIPVSGGLAPYTFTPDGAPYAFSDFGLSLNTGTGAITGTSTATPGQNIPIGVTIQDSQGQSTDITFFLQTDAPLSFNPGNLPDATQGANYSVPLSASGGTPPYTFQATGLPTGINLNVNTLVGQCTASSANVELSVIDSVNGSVSVGPLFINCNPSPLITNPSPLPNGKVDQGYIFQFMTNATFDSPGAAPYKWSAAASPLPAGLTLGPQTGLLMGTPTTAGTSTLTITFTDRWNATTSAQFQLTVSNTLAITTSQLPDGTLNFAYPAGAALGAAGGSPPYHFSATGLPTGLTIDNNTGAITGSPTVAGLFNPNFILTDQSTANAHASIPITVAAAGTTSEDWIQLFPTYAPTPRSGGVAFYDSVRNQTVLFGGVYASLLNETDVWNGTNWTLLSPTNSPPPRSGAAAAFDAAHGVGVLFGGLNQTSDTWLWNGTTWTQATPANSPSPRSNAMMAYDGHQIVLFGGVSSGGDLNETWIWNGSNWTQITASVSGTPPEARDSGAMAYDSAHGQVILFGGIQGSGDFADTWIWNGAQLTWTLLTNLSNHPQSRNQNMMAYDPVHGQTILFGGNSAETLQPFDDTWAWNGSAWTELNPPHSPGARTSGVMAFDTAQSQVLVFGGNIAATESFGNDTWNLEGPFVSNLALPDATQNVSYSAGITVQDGVSPFTFAAPTLPPGITFNTTNGSFGGAPTGVSTYNIPVTIQDSDGVSIAPTLTLTVSAALVLLPASLPDATMGANYLVQLSATGGVLNYSFQVTGLPNGLTFNSSNQIVGQCTASSTNVILKVTDSAVPTPSTSTVGPIPLNCNPAPLITNASPLAGGTVGTSYSVQLTTNAVYDPPGAAPYTWSVPPNSLPPGLGLSATGLISGIPTAAGPTTFTVTFTDVWHATTSKQFQVSVVNALSITTTALALGTLNIAYPSGQAIAATGGNPAYHFTASGLPPGLGIDNNTGAITGIPTQAGSFTPNFTVTDQATGNAQMVIPITVAAAGTNTEDWIQLSPAFSPPARETAAIFYDSVRNQTILFGGFTSTGPVNDTVAWNGTNWATVSTTGPQPRGLPAAAFDVAHGQGVLFGGQINGVPLADTRLWNGTAWTPVTPNHNPPARWGAKMVWDGHQIVLFGGATSVTSDLNDTWTWNGTDWTNIPASVSGTPPGVRENFGFAYDSGHGQVVLFSGHNAATQTNYADMWIWNGANTTWTPLNVTPQPLPRSFFPMVYDQAHSQIVLFGGSATGGVYYDDTWAWNGTAWTNLNPPHNPGTRIDSAMVFDGVSSRVLLFGGDSIAADVDLADTWVVAGPVVTNLVLPAATLNVPYSQPISLTSGAPPYSFSAPTLPPGITFNSSTGTFGGIPTALNTYQIPVTIQDSEGVSIAPIFSLTVSSSLTLLPATIPNATAATNYSVPLSAVGGVPAYSFTVSGLPAGLQFTANNQIVGQCTASSSNVMLSVTDSATPTPNTYTVGPLTVVCNALPAITTPSPLPSGVVGTAYSQGIQMTGGTAPISWVLTPGTLPSGFQLSSTGVLTGAPAAPFSAQFSVKITDFWGATFTKPYTLAVYPVLSITTSSLPNGTAGTAYQSGVTIAASGGTGSVTYSFTATGLPSGYAVDLSSGTLAGNTTQTGLFTPVFKVTDQDAQIATKQINLTVLSGSGLTILSPKTLPAGTSGQPYSYQLQWSGGVSPFNVTSTALPGWLTLNAGTGLLTGTPTSGGAFVFPITVTDSQAPTPNSASQTETIVVNPPTITTTSPLPTATVGNAYAQNLAAIGGKSPYNWTSTNLPAWLSLSSAGALTGTPPVNTPASVLFNATVTDSLGAFTSGSFTLPVLPAPGLYFLTASPLPPATPNVPYSTTVQVGGGDGVYSVSPTGLPSWLNFNSTTLVLSGTPPSAGPVTFQLTLSDDVAQSLTQNFTLPVNAALTFGNTSPLPPATVGLPYSETLTASGGSGSYKWSATGLPPWLSLSTGGVLSGSPTVAGPVSFGITVTDSQKNSLNATFVLPVEAILIIDTATPLPAATLNFPYLATFTASGGGGGYQWSATGLPSGFTLSPSGFLLGTPQAGTPIVFNVTVTDSLKNSVNESFTLPVNVTLTINTQSPLPPATVLLPYSANFTASGGNPGYTWTASGLPSWLNLTAAGYLSGTPPSGATAPTFPVTVTDSATHSATSTFTVPMNGSLTITTASLPLATVNVYYSKTLAATGGDGVYTWSATGLPSGLSISAAGVLSGSVSQAGPYPFAITVNDTKGSVASKNFTLLVSTGLPLSYVTQNLTSCVANTYCSNQIAAAGGVPPYTFSLGSTANLDGFSISASGLLSGTPPSGGTIGIPVVLADQVTSLPQTFPLTVYSGLTVTTTSLAGGTVGVNYGAGLLASGGKPPYTWSLAAVTQPPGTLPPGLNLDSQSGDIYGTPGTAGTYSFFVQVTDGVQTSPPHQLSIAIAPASPPPPAILTVVNAQELPSGTVGTAYSDTLAAVGGSGQYTWTLTGGSLPAGLSLAKNGAITGTPTTAQTANFNATVKDTGGNSVATGFTILVTSPTSVGLLTPNPLPNGVVGVLYSYAIHVTGGTAPYTYSITAGQVPPGLTFDETTGALNGTPTTAGSFGITLTVDDSGGTVTGTSGSLAARLSPRATATVTSNYTIGVSGPGDFQIVTGQDLPGGTLGLSYSTTLTASGGQSPYQWQLVDGTLPTGLALSSTGIISGTPAQALTAPLVIKVTDNTGAISTGAFLLQIIDPNTPSINASAPLPPGTVGAGYGSGLIAAGGHSPYSWAIVTGTLPLGLSLDAQGGIISGTPTKAGNFPFTAQVTDTDRVSATQAFAIAVHSPTLQITPASIPNGTANVPYSFGLSVAGGTAPYNWSLSAGGLLTGFSINPSTGAISGTPTLPGAYQFTISVVDSNFGLATQTYQFTVASQSLTISTTSVPSGTVGTAYDFGLLATNSTPPLNWSVISGALPPGIQLMASSGLLVGTPTTAGSYTFTLQVTDQTTAMAQATFTVQVSPAPLTIVNSPPPGGSAGTGYSLTLKSSGGTGAITWSVTSGTLPAGLSLGATTGIISGTPMVAGSFTITVEATDASGVTAQQSITLNIAGPPPAPAITLSGLPATSKPGDQPTVTITLASPYSLPIVVTATLALTPNPGNSTDLKFANGLRTTQLTIPANTTTATLAFQTGTLAGSIQLSLSLSALGINITPPVAPAATTAIATTAPTISSVSVATSAGGLQVTVVGTSTTLDMQTATFQFTPAAGANLQTTSVSVNVSSLFAAWYKNPASLATGSQFSLTEPFTISGNISAIASVTVTLTNSVGASAAASANVP